VNAQPVEGEKAILIQVRETNGKPADLKTLKQNSGILYRITQINAIGEAINNGSTSLKSLGNGFFKLDW
jgi:hypothetical protein